MNFRKEIFSIPAIMLLGASAGMAIISSKWIYLVFAISPILIYFSIRTPFIFPFGLYAFMLPFDNLLSISGSGGGNTLTKLLGVISIFLLFISGIAEKRIRKPGKVVVWWGLFIIYGIISMAWAIDPEKTLEKLPTMVGLFLLYAMVSSYKVEEKELVTLKKMIIYGGIAASFYELISFFFYGVTYEETVGRGSLIFAERQTDPNQLAFSLLLPFAVLLESSVRKTKKTISLLFSGILACAILITGSRGGFLGMTTIILIYLLKANKKNHVLIIILAIVMAIFNLVPEMFFGRLSESYVTGGSGRLEIWKAGMAALKHYWFLGAGLDNFPEAFNQFRNFVNFVGYDRVAHNIYLGFAVELGIIGFALLLIVFYKHYELVNEMSDINEPTNVFLKASIAGTMVSGFFLDIVWAKSFWLLWILVTLSNIGSKKEVLRNNL